MKIKNTLSVAGIAFMLLFVFGSNSSQAQIWPGYTLIAPSSATTAYMLDSSGNTYHTWTLTGKTGYSAFLAPGGILVRSVAHTGNYYQGGPTCGEVQKVDWNGNIIWNYVYSTVDYCAHHDICPMPNGNVLLIAYEGRTPAQVTAAGASISTTIWPDKIVEVKPTGATTGEVVWEWHIWDHLVQSFDSTKANYAKSVADHPELLNINYSLKKDWIHMNGVDYNAELDQIAFSSHNLNEIYVIDHSTTTAEAALHSGGKYNKGGDFLYRWGNPIAYSTTGTQILKVVHDAHWIPNGCPRAGSLVGFNNQGVSTTKSAVDIASPPYTSDFNYSKTAGVAFEPTSYTYRHQANGYTSNEGGSQQLPNGNMIVCIAKSGIVYEIDPSENVLWTKTISGGLAQAHKYSKCYIDGTLADTPTISLSGSMLTSSTASAYQWYYKGEPIAGATAQTYSPTVDGRYYVSIKNATGCESPLSKAFSYTGATGLDQSLKTDFTLYPNPAGNMLYVEGDMPTEGVDLSITDMNGKLLLSVNKTRSADLSELSTGIYIVTIQDGLQHCVKKISVVK